MLFAMRNEFTTVIERDGDWFVAWSPEIPGANGQGSTLEDFKDLSAAIHLVLDDHRADAAFC
jgi:predicted RNase H-like HicB family nuclease